MEAVSVRRELPGRAPQQDKWDRARHFYHVTRALAMTEFKLRYFGSVLGYLWTLLKPLLLFGVLFVVFTRIVRIGQAVPHYPVMLLTGIVLFNFFGEATSGALGSLLARENLLRKVAFPRAAVPVAVSFTSMLNLLLGFSVVLLLALINGVEVRASWFLLIIVILFVMFLVMALGLLLSILYVSYRDVAPIWEVVLQLLFWGSPIIYTIESVPSKLRHLIMLNPLADAIQQARHWLVGPSVPSAAQAAGGSGRLLIPLLFFLVLVGLSGWLFHRRAPRAAEDL